jgi:hypothetical protein
MGVEAMGVEAVGVVDEGNDGRRRRNDEGKEK